MVDRTNEEWLAALRGPEREEALEDLRSLLIRGLRYALPNVPDQSREDFAQEALLKILDGLDTFRGESRFTTWATKIAVHQALSELRRRRWKDVSLQEILSRYEGADFTPALLTDPSPSPEQRVTQQALMELVVRLIDEELTPLQRQALIAVMIGGMPLQEVARRIGTNRNALYKRLHDARHRLQEEMLARGVSPQDVLAVFEKGKAGREM